MSACPKCGRYPPDTFPNRYGECASCIQGHNTARITASEAAEPLRYLIHTLADVRLRNVMLEALDDLVRDYALALQAFGNGANPSEVRPA